MFSRQAPSSSAPFRSLATAAELEDAIATSFTEPVLIFKHSRACGTSAEAYEELTTLLATGVAGAWYLVDVLGHRPLSNEITRRFGVRHESPQILLLASGQVRWSGSHYRVTGAAVQSALAQFAPA